MAWTIEYDPILEIHLDDGDCIELSRFASLS